MKLTEFNPGDIVDYHNIPCIVLEYRNEGILVAYANPFICQFGRTNNFAHSLLLELMFNNVCSVFPSSELIRHKVDLIALNGGSEYCFCEPFAAPLTLEEYKRFLPILEQHRSKEWPGLFEWTATPWGTPLRGGDDGLVVCISSTSNIVYAHYSDECLARPAFLLSPDQEVRGIHKSQTIPYPELVRFSTENSI